MYEMIFFVVAEMRHGRWVIHAFRVKNVIHVKI